LFIPLLLVITNNWLLIKKHHSDSDYYWSFGGTKSWSQVWQQKYNTLLINLTVNTNVLQIIYL
jgi:hypothetical protein